MAEEEESFVPPIYEFNTPGKCEFQYKHITCGTINFTVRATYEACISLVADPNTSDKGYEVVIGGSNNTVTTIRRLKDEAERVKVKTPNVLDAKKAVGFWVSWHGGNIAVGLKNETKAIAQWKDPDPILITHYAVCTGCCHTGNWVIEDFWKITTIEKCTYCYRPILWGSMTVTINAPHDAYIQLTSNPGKTDEFCVILLGTADNTTCYILYSHDGKMMAYTITPNILSKHMMIYVTWINGNVRVLYEDKQLITAWENPNPFMISCFGVCTSNGATGHFIVQASLNHFTESPNFNGPEYTFNTPAQFKYQFRQFARGMINFRAKFSRDANVKLTDDPFNEESAYWITFGRGANTHSTIQKGKVDKLLVYALTPGICSNDEFRGYWVSWNETGVAVGMEGNIYPFMRLTDTKIIKVIWYGVMTSHGSNGEWLIEGFQKILTPDNAEIYKHYPITWGNLRVGINAPKDAHVAIANIHDEKEPIYQIILGCYDNSTSQISYHWNRVKKANVSTPGILVEGQTVNFLITWFNGDVAVFTHDEKTGSDRLLLAWQDTNPIFGTRYFGVSTSENSEGHFTVIEPSLTRLTVSEPSQTSQKYHFKTPAELDFQYKPIINGSINFTVKGCGDASIALTNEPKKKNYAYEITLRTLPSHDTMIRYGENQEIVAAVETLGILSGDEPKGFWIRWYNGCIDAGQKGHNLPFVRWTDPNPVSVTHYAVSTSDNVYGDWLIEDVWDIKTQSSLEYDYKPILWGFLKVAIQAESEAHVEITPDPTQKDKRYEIVFGTENNKRTCIFYGHNKLMADALTDPVLDGSEPKIFYIIWFDTYINVFTKAKNLLAASEDKTVQMAFGQVGVSTKVCTGEFSVWPSLDHVTIKVPLFHTNCVLNTSKVVEELIRDGSIHFAVKASESASIKLASTSDEVQLGYEIILGEKRNTQSIIKTLSLNDPYNSMTKTKDILSEDESREFWIIWNCGTITVGKKGQHMPFLAWYDDNTCVDHISNYEVSTPEGTAGAWLVEGIVEVVTPEIGKADELRRPILWGHLDVGIKALKDAQIALPNNGKGIAETLYLIIIGGSNNTTTEMLLGTKKLLTASTHTPGILSLEKTEDFEITWFNGWVNVLHHNRILVTWKDTQPFGIYKVCFSALTLVKGFFHFHASLDHVTPSEDISTPKKMNFVAPNVKHYQYRPILSGSINFTVKACSDAQIVLTDDPHNKDYPYEIVLGMMSNRKTEIRKGKCTCENASAVTPDILSGDEPRGFWIRWNNGTIAVGKKGELMPIVQWAHSKPFPVISHYGLCTKMNSFGEWVVEDHWEIQTQDDSDYSFYPILWGYAEVVVNSKHDGLFALSTKDGFISRLYEMQLGSYGNTACHITIGQHDVMAKTETPDYLKEGVDTPFLITWFNGWFCAFDKERKLVIGWEDKTPIAMCYLGASCFPGAFGYFVAAPTLDHFIFSDSFSSKMARQHYDIDTSAGVEYQFKRIVSGRINFTVKAHNDAHLVLTNDPADEETRYWIVIGGWENTQTAIRLGTSNQSYDFVLTPDILSGDEFRGFWITWDDGSVALGKKDCVVPLLRWVNKKPFKISYCGIFTGWGSDGDWVIEGFQKYHTENYKPFTYFPILWGLMDVTIVAPQDGHIALTSGPTETIQMYHIAIGIHNNTASEICYGNRNITEVHVDTPDVLSKDKEKKFLITWFNGVVNVLLDGRLFLAWEDSNNAFPVNYFGVCTTSDVGHFSVCPSLERFTPSEVIKPTKFLLPVPVTNTYVFKPITQGSINFSVKANSDAHVALAEGTDYDWNLKYEIIFGANDNEKTIIQKQDKTGKKEDKAWSNTKDILKGDEHRGFWVRWNNGVVAAGKKGREMPILQWIDTETPSVLTHYAVGSGEGAEWLIEDTIPVPNTDIDNFVYEPIVWGRLNVTVNAPHNGMIALKTNLKDDKNLYIIALGRTNNAKSSIDYGEGIHTLKAEVSTPFIMSQGKDEPFLITWFNGVIAVYFNNLLLLTWENDDYVSGISAFGVGAWFGAQGLFTATASLDNFTKKEPLNINRIEYHFKTPDHFEYQFETIFSGVINFTLKAKPEAHVSLSNDSCKLHEIYKVIFGQNSKWTSISKENIEKAKVATTGILSNKDSRGFWISWHKGTVQVGQKGSKKPLISWTDPEPESITHYAVSTMGSIGYWVIEDFWKITTYPKWEYGYRKILWGSLDVTINAPHDAFIALTTARVETFPMYHIVLGSYDNSKCEIRYGPKEEEKVSVNLHALSKGKYKAFLITWFNGDVQVYTCQEMMTDCRKLIMQWTDTDPFLISNFGVSTWFKATGNFKVYPSLERIKMTDDSQKVRKKKIVEAMDIREVNMVRNLSEVEI